MSTLDNQALDTVATGISKFSTEFYKSLAEDETSNFICSPLSVSMVLSMVTYGARGQTEKELRSALRLSKDDQINKNGFQSLIDTLNAVKKVELRLANKIYFNTGFDVKSEFKVLTETTFRSVSEIIDFGKTEEASKTINSWCEEKTNNRIKDVIQPNDLTGAEMVLVNAVYFKGHWKKKFDPTSTSPKPFHIDENTTKDVPMMYQNAYYKFNELPALEATCIELPYKSNNSSDSISMFIILPNQIKGLKKIESNLHEINFKDLHNRRSMEITLLLPKFKVESRFELQNTLSKMGVKEIFEDSADLRGIAEPAQLKVSKVFQKAFIEVNEDGSEAAAVTIKMTRSINIYSSLIIIYVILLTFIDAYSVLSAIKSEPTFYKFSTKFTEVALESHNNNLICSPLSAAIALSMITYGVRNKSEEELVSALYYPKYNKYNAIYKMKTFLDNLNSFKDLDLHIANKLFIAKKFLVKPQFKELTRIYYQSESENVDFTKPQEAADLINNWSARNTNNRIKELVEADNFDVDTSLVLVNAIYLKAKWLNAFYADNTKLLPFYINSEEYKNVPMMYQQNEFKCGHIEDLKAEYIELPYRGVSHMGSTVSMYIFLPYEGISLKTIEENLHKLHATDFHHNYNRLTVKLQLPRFKLDSTIDLKSHLIKMGVNEIFKATDNFYDISDSRPLKITNVIQKAFIDVNENGSEAGAVTAFRVESRMLDDSNVKSFNVNRPFIMLISTPRNILFSARIADPSL
ncbi:uncharacterized protein LOC130663233 [Microplitis mediator]|uniref:uncharacterized protein LOC130663233 n=1 Tax=Microplitis mediator TaxID=375433 RepID=UPI002553B5FA|nr:uncharacterized protein LOC130663233 [Microplitis mediator]